MKYIKMLGLAAVAAMALMAFLGAGSASATALCKTNTTLDCVSSGWHYPVGTTIVGTSTNTVLTSGSEPVTCKHSEVSGTTTNTGGPTETIDTNTIALSFTECNHPVVVKAPGTLEIHHNTGGKATLTSKGASVTVSIFGISCVYGTPVGGKKIGEVTSEGATPTIGVSVGVEKQEGSFLCPGEPTWEGTYTIKSPTPLWVTEG